MKFLRAEQHAALAQQLDDVGVRVENVFASKIRQTGFLSEAGRDRPPAIESADPVRLPRLVIVFAVTGGDVDGAGAGVHGHEIGGEHDRVAIKKWMARFDPVDLAPGNDCERFTDRIESLCLRKIAGPISRRASKVSVAPLR